MDIIQTILSIDWEVLATLLLSGGFIGGILTSYFGKHIERYFGFIEYKDEILKKRYKYIYSRLIYKVMTVDYYWEMKPTFKTQIPHIKEALNNNQWKKTIILITDMVKHKNRYELPPGSRFNIVGLKAHIEKYGEYADFKLTELLSKALWAEKIIYEDAEPYQESYESMPLSQEAHELIYYINQQHKTLNRKLSPK